MATGKANLVLGWPLQKATMGLGTDLGKDQHSFHVHLLVLL